jgi:hypothetical protein
MLGLPTTASGLAGCAWAAAKRKVGSRATPPAKLRRVMVFKSLTRPQLFGPTKSGALFRVSLPIGHSPDMPSLQLCHWFLF